MDIDTEGPSGSQESQPWDNEDEHWAQDCDGEFETNPEDDEEYSDPTKQTPQAGTRNSLLIQAVSIKLREYKPNTNHMSRKSPQSLPSY